jgi:hypothetical protein
MLSLGSCPAIHSTTIHVAFKVCPFAGSLADPSMNTRNRRTGAWFLTLVAGAILVLLSACSLPQVTAEERIFLGLSLDFLGEYQLSETTFAETTVGGVSALTYDRQQDCFYALSDDRSRNAPARFYTLKLVIDAASPAETRLNRVELQGVTFLKQENGQLYSQDTLDPEGVALSPHQSIFVSSEGITNQSISPFVAEFDLKTGRKRRSLSVPERYLPNPTGAEPQQGIADNLGFEPLALNPEGDRLFTATESALIQDHDTADPEQAVRSRLLHYWIGEPESFLVSEHLYLLNPIPTGAVANGLVELTAIDGGGHFLSLERSYGLFTGPSAQIFQVSMAGANDVSQFKSLKGSLKGVQPVQKRLLLDLSQLRIPLGNLEGMALGPRLKDGTQSLLLVSDNNFDADQPTQFLLFRLRQD